MTHQLVSEHRSWPRRKITKVSRAFIFMECGHYCVRTSKSREFKARYWRCRKCAETPLTIKDLLLRRLKDAERNQG
jgi:hypothetical protein